MFAILLLLSAILTVSPDFDDRSAKLKQSEAISFESILDIALSNSFLSPEDVATVRFKLCRSSLDGMMSLFARDNIVAVMERVRNLAVYIDDRKFMIDFLRYKSKEVSEILEKYCVAADTEYQPALLTELEPVFIAFATGLSSRCLAEYLPGALLLRYDKYFESIPFEEASTPTLPREQKGFEYVASISSAFPITPHIRILSSDIIQLSNYNTKMYYDISKRCAVRLRAGLDASFLPEHRVILLRRVSSYTTPATLFAGHRKVKKYQLKDKSSIMRMSLHLDSTGTLPWMMAVISKSETIGPSKVFIYDALTGETVSTHTEIFSSVLSFGIHGDYLVHDHPSHVRIVAPIRGQRSRLPTELLHTEKAGFQLLPRPGSGQIRRIQSTTTANFAAGTAVTFAPQVRARDILHVYRIPQLKLKLRGIVAAVEEFWSAPGNPELVAAKEKTDKLHSVLAIGSRQSVSSDGDGKRDVDWPFKALKAFEADKYNEMTVAHLEKLLSQ
jgi:hypothetical protein